MRRALFVDDDHMTWMPVLQPAAEASGWTLDAQAGVADGVNAARAGVYDVVLLDLAFPADRLVGSAAVQRFRRECPSLPIVVLTAADTAADIRTALDCVKEGAWEYFTKSSLDLRRLFAEMHRAAAHVDATRRQQRLLTSFSRIADSPSPAFLEQAHADGVRVTCGFRLGGLALPSDSDRRTLELWAATQRAWQAKLVVGLLTEAGGRVVDLRYLVDPESNGAVDVICLGGSLGRDAAEAHLRAGEVWADLLSLLRMNAAIYDFQVLTDEDAVRAALAPFRPREIAEIGRPTLAVRRGVRSGPVGFAASPDTGPDPAMVRLPATFLNSEETSTLQPLCSLLVSQHARTLVSIRVGCRRPDVQALASEVMQDLEGPPERAWIIEAAGGLKHAPSNVSELAKRLVLLRDLPSYDARVLVASESPISSALLNVVASDLVASQADLAEVRRWSRADLESFDWWSENRSSCQREGLAVTLTASEVARVFRLPIVTEPFPALPTFLRRARYLPEGVITDGCVLGEKRLAGGSVSVALTRDDRDKHVYVVGQTGTGKSTLLASMILSDIEAGLGVGVIDPHGDLVSAVLERLPPERVDDVVLIDPADREWPVGLNLLDNDDADQHDFISSELLLMIRKWFDPSLREPAMFGPIFQQALRAAIRTALAVPMGLTAVDIPLLFEDDAFRAACLASISDPALTAYWRRTWPGVRKNSHEDNLSYFTSKLDGLRQNTTLRHVLGQRRSSIDMRGMMDTRKIALLPLSIGRLGIADAGFVGSLVTAQVLAAALSRADTPPAARVPFVLYIDEFQNFTTDSIGTIVSQARKFGLALVLAHQNLAQLPERLLEEVQGNVGSLIAFRPGPPDAQRLARYFVPDYDPDALLALPNWTAVARLLSHQRMLPPFEFNTVVNSRPPDITVAERARALSRQRYGRRRQDVERELARRWGISSWNLNTDLTDIPWSSGILGVLTELGARRVADLHDVDRTAFLDAVQGDERCWQEIVEFLGWIGAALEESG